MGNCQAAEAATVVIQHSNGHVERIYWSIPASQVMASNPGHYVAIIITSAPKPKPKPHNSTFRDNTTSTSTTRGGGTSSGKVVKHLKLLRPDDTLHIGHAYRLISFEEVLKEFASKKYVKLSKLLAAQKEKARREAQKAESSQDHQAVEEEVEAREEHLHSYNRPSGPTSRAGQWRPSLQSIAEIGN